MVKKSQRKKSRRLFLLLGIVNVLLIVGIVIALFSSYFNLIIDSLPFLSKSASQPTFYGENIDMSQILPTSQNYVVNRKGQDLIDIAATLGINLIRITNAKRSFNNNEDAIYTKEQWDQVLSKMQSKGIKALILIETASNNKEYYTPDIRPVYLHLVKEYIDSGVFSNPDVYAVDMKNEPLLTDANINMLQAAHAMIKEKYPDLKQTIGWWASTKSPEDPYNPNNYNWSDFSAGQKIGSMVDFYSIHMYGLDTNKFGVNLGPDLKTKVFLSRVENGLQTRKPILIGEFGEANGDAVSDQDTIGNPQLQANIYQGVYQALKEMHNSQIMGAIAFDFYSRTQYNDAWAIVKNKGEYLFPAAYVMQEYALGKSNVSLKEATVVHSQSYLLKNADNYGTKSVKRYDRVGLKVQLASGANYVVLLSPSGVLQPIETFHYDPVSDSSYAVYWVARQGNVDLRIVPTTICAACTGKGPPVYRVTIHVTFP